MGAKTKRSGLLLSHWGWLLDYANHMQFENTTLSESYMLAKFCWAIIYHRIWSFAVLLPCPCGLFFGSDVILYFRFFSSCPIQTVRTHDRNIQRQFSWCLAKILRNHWTVNKSLFCHRFKWIHKFGIAIKLVLNYWLSKKINLVFSRFKFALRRIKINEILIYSWFFFHTSI